MMPDVEGSGSATSRRSAGWFADPLAMHRVRYWSGTAWTDRVADSADVFTDPARQRRFHAEIQIVVGPLLLAVWAYAAYFAIVYGSTATALLVTVPWLLFAAVLLMTPYVAILDLDGTLMFRAVTRTVSTTIDSVVRIGYTPVQGQGWKFDFGVGRASLGGFGGQRLTEFLTARRPELARGPSSWRGWW